MLLKEMLVSKNNELSDVIKSLDDEAMAQRPDGICVSRKDVTELQETINKKREVCDKVKLEILTIQASLSELQKTENTIRLQQSEMLSHHHTKERIAGVAKFTGINDKLVATSKETASLNEMKARTLEDISVMVQEIASKLEVKQHELRPKVRLV